MKIVMLCDLYADKLQYQENLLARYYIKLGHDVTVVAATFEDAVAYYAHRYDKEAPARTYRDESVKVIKLPYSLNLLNRLRRFAGVAELLAREKPDLIFVHDIHLNLPEAANYKKAHPACRIIMDYHADRTNSAKNWLSLTILHKLTRKRLLLRYRRYIDKICPVTPASAEFLNEVYGIAREEMELLPLGADTDRAESVMRANPGAGVRDTLGIPQDAVVIFTGGKLAPSKRTEVLLDAFIELRNPNLHVIIVGDSEGGAAAYKLGLVARCANYPCAHFVGWVAGDDVYNYMNACDFAVFPGSQSVLWQQALCMGLPLIVGGGTQRGTQDPSYLNLYGNVIILDVADIRADVIAKQIQRWLDNPAVLKQLQAAALRACDELLNYDTIVEGTLEFDRKHTSNRRLDSMPGPTT